VRTTDFLRQCLILFNALSFGSYVPLLGNPCQPKTFPYPSRFCLLSLNGGMTR